MIWDLAVLYVRRAARALRLLGHEVWQLLTYPICRTHRRNP